MGRKHLRNKEGELSMAEIWMNKGKDSYSGRFIFRKGILQSSERAYFVLEAFLYTKHGRHDGS
mgnify:CR=1 FL=1